MFGEFFYFIQKLKHMLMLHATLYVFLSIIIIYLFIYPSSDEVKTEGSYISTYPMCLHGACVCRESLILHIFIYQFVHVSACLFIRRCIQKSQDNAHNTQVACSSRVSR
jgi:hypothetical protein